MPFVNPLLLLGLGSASIPIIIHLLNKRRFKVLDWAAMEFLLASLRRNYRRLRIEELVLLAIRTLLIALLVIGVARPIVGSNKLLGFLPETRRFIAILVDASFSMSYKQGVRSVFSRAKDSVRAILNGLRSSDTVSLVSFASSPTTLTGDAGVEPRQAAGELEALEPTHETSDALSALLYISEKVRAADASGKSVYLLSDFQRVAFDPDRRRPAETLKALRELGRSAELIFVDVGFEDAANLAVTVPRTEAKIVTPGSTTPISAAVKNFSPLARQLRVELLVDRTLQGASVVEVKGGSEAPVEFVANLTGPGTHTVELKLESDNLPLDNRSYLSVLVRRAVRVLLVDGEPGQEKIDSEVFYLKEALLPEGGEELAIAVPELTTPDTMLSLVFDEFDAVVLANVASLPEESFGQLADYVSRGGSLLIFLGDRVRAEFYNTTMVKLSGVRITAEQRGPTHLTVKDYSHPAFRLFRGLRLTRVESATFRGRWLTEQSGGRVLMEFGSGEPALVEREHGQGKVFLFASSADTEWSDFPTRPSYPAFVNELVKYAARDPSRHLNLRVGEPLIARLPGEFFSRRIELELPRGGSRALSPIPEGRWVVCRYPSIPQAGIYSLRAGGLRRHYAASLPAEESNLKRIEAAELRELLPGVKFRHERGRRGEAQAASTVSRSELARVLLCSLLALAFIELFLAQRFTR